METLLGYSHDEVQKALDSLKEKGLIYGGENILGCPYGLSDSNVKICDANGAVIEINEEYVLKEESKDLPNIRSIEGTAYSGKNDRIESIKKVIRLYCKQTITVSIILPLQ